VGQLVPLRLREEEEPMHLVILVLVLGLRVEPHLLPSQLLVLFL
jgi:hypothetical protein